ncbi:Coadhesin,Hemicentin-1,Thrombospondin-2 [Mytilus edulis]|uniref:Coadhesin,Hemicentin-1,Thrombospondin-2 n=1 Tax=Mytilus edulis TaxID=6550 RepID=A0A8S3RLZ1_MYTED|nr:Coadhesin,Hemicentin-1,Thrombospondin-2 [Mytilus edulis]
MRLDILVFITLPTVTIVNSVCVGYQTYKCSQTSSEYYNYSRACGTFGWKRCRGQKRRYYKTYKTCTRQCPSVDGYWSSWSSWRGWSTCTKNCGTGGQVRTRTRSCTNPRPLNGGQHCYGLTTGTERRQCNTNPCPVDGKWSSWSSWRGWSTCTKNCGTGNQVRTRTRYCTKPKATIWWKSMSWTHHSIDGEWSSFGSWSPWSSCNVTCDGGTKSRSKNRTCTNPEPKYGGQTCNGSTTETTAVLCNSMACPIDGEWSSFGSWSPWSSCNVTCGGGTKSRSKNRTCTNPEPKYGGQTCNGSTTETTAVLCNSMACPIDGEWSPFGTWSFWSVCSVSCGGGEKSRSRNRTCSNPLPKYGGKQCIGNSMENTSSHCNLLPCPINGEWSPFGIWSSWSLCSSSCGGGEKTRSRNRTCSNPIPLYGGKQCSGYADENTTSDCNTIQCPIDGEWSSFGIWSSWFSCSLTCGGGEKIRIRNRTCSNPVPSHGGKQCTGNETEHTTSECNTLHCPIDGGWSSYGNWSSWSLCNVTCGGGKKSRIRNRTCSNPVPKYYGKQCIGMALENITADCNTLFCPINGGWSQYTVWSRWGNCSRECDSGLKYRTRSRSCTNPKPKFDGLECTGNTTDEEEEICNIHHCPLDGNWTDYSEWSSWDTCNVTCGGGFYSRYRNRTCKNPEPMFGGKNCSGDDIDQQKGNCNKQKCIAIEISDVPKILSSEIFKKALYYGIIPGALLLILCVVIVCVIVRKRRRSSISLETYNFQNTTYMTPGKDDAICKDTKLTCNLEEKQITDEKEEEEERYTDMDNKLICSANTDTEHYDYARDDEDHYDTL